MKQDMSSADVAAVVAELSAGPKSILDSKIGKIYQLSEEEIRINLYIFNKGRDNLIIEAGKRLHMSKYLRPSPSLPQAFPMLLRKHLMGGRIVSVEQHDFDRIVKIGIVRGEIKNTLIIELFARGNIVLIDSENRILLPMKPVTLKGRRIRSGEIYELPEAQLSPLKTGVSELMEAFSKSTADIVRTIATGFNLGGVLAEETCLRAGIDKAKPAKEATKEEAALLAAAMQEMFTPLLALRKAEGAEQPGLKPQHIKKEINGKVESFEVVPFELSRYSEFEKEYFDSFNTALDEFFGKKSLEEIKEEKQAEKKEKTLNIFERRLLQQKEAIDKFEKEIEKNTALAESIYSNYPIIEELFSVLNKAREKGYSWNEIRSILKKARKSLPAAQKIVNIDPKNASVQVELDGLKVNLDIRKTLPQNAETYYDKVKKLNKKKEGALRAIEDTKKALEKKPVAKKTEKKFRARRKKHWYDRFRWFVSSDGFLIVGGRDADTNEELFKKYMEKRDLVFHTQTPGAPLTIIKSLGKEIPKSTLQEAAQFAVSYSSLWKAGHFSGDCYSIQPEQVTKTPESGEYLKKGAFVIRGERTYYRNVPLGIAIGLELKGETRVIGGPVSAVRKQGNYILEVVPGKFNQNDISKKAYRIYAEELKDPRFVKQIASPDQIAMMMPPGESNLKSKKPEKETRSKQGKEEKEERKNESYKAFP